MQFEHLREFVALAGVLNFSECAKQLYISQSTLSKHITLLEDELGTQLFHRGGHQLELTNVGYAFLEGAQGVIDRYERMLVAVDAAKRSYEHLLIVGFMRRGTGSYAIQFQKWISDNHPNVGTLIKAEEYPAIIDDLKEKRIDFAFTFDTSPLLADLCEMRPLCHVERMLAVPSNHPWVGRNSISIAEIASQPLILPSPTTDPITYNRVIDSLAAVGKPDVAAYYLDIDTLLFDVASGLGMAFVPSIPDEPYDADIKLIPIEEANLGLNICAVWLKSLEENRKWIIRSFIETITSCSGGLNRP